MYGMRLALVGGAVNDDYPTPEWLRKMFAGWDDPCPLGGAGVGDGLLREWGDPTFANIPYSEPMKWVEKAIMETRRGKRVVLLVRVDTSTRWWSKLVEAGARFAFFHGRISFNGARANFASALVFLP